jgi:hypothetical protein
VTEDPIVPPPRPASDDRIPAKTWILENEEANISPLTNHLKIKRVSDKATHETRKSVPNSGDNISNRVFATKPSAASDAIQLLPPP